MAAWSASYEEPVTLDFHGVTVCKIGPWGQGPALLQTLAILAGFEPHEIDPSTADGAHRVLEALKLALADRDAHYGDEDVALDVLLSEEYAAARRALIGPEASHEFRPGDVGGAPAYRPPLVTEYLGPEAGAAAGEPTVSVAGSTRGDTCHIDVVDRWGNLVSATPSGGWLQSSPVVPELGFPLGTRAQMFWLEPGLPNSLAPGKRPRTTLTPSLAFRGGVPTLAFGTPGGDQQEQWQLCFWLAHTFGGLDLQASIDAPAWHTTSFPSSFYPRDMTPGQIVVESRLGDEAIASLRARGHDVVVSDAWSLGRLSAVSRDPETGILRAAANPRGMQGYAVGR
jgi:gamma-glutamyltranspeptidase/glutathione hydrolase